LIVAKFCFYRVFGADPAPVLRLGSALRRNDPSPPQ
jgi:hypothetical protein